MMRARLSILKNSNIIGDADYDNPKPVTDEAVAKYVGNNAVCQFTDIYLCNPWVSNNKRNQSS